jgi:hypothetical protein
MKTNYLVASMLMAAAISLNSCNEATEGDGDAGSDTHGVTADSTNTDVNNTNGTEPTFQDNNKTTPGNDTSNNGDTTGTGASGRPNGSTGANQQYNYDKNYHTGSGYAGGSYMPQDNYKNTNKTGAKSGSGSSSGENSGSDNSTRH